MMKMAVEKWRGESDWKLQRKQKREMSGMAEKDGSGYGGGDAGKLKQQQ